MSEFFTTLAIAVGVFGGIAGLLVLAIQGGGWLANKFFGRR